jgi:hypothetical protein
LRRLWIRRCIIWVLKRIVWFVDFGF